MAAPDIIVRDNGAGAGDIAVATAFVHGVGETVGLAESIYSSLSAVQSAETVALSEGVAALRRGLSLLTETVAWAESQAHVMTRRAVLSETVAFNEGMFGGTPYVAALNETVDLDEETDEIPASVVHLAETNALETSLAEVLTIASPGGYGVLSPQLVPLAELLLASWDTRVSLSEGVSLAESATGGGDSALVLTETVTLAEAFRGGQSFVEPLSETVSGLAGALVGRARPRAPLAEIVNLSERVGLQVARHLGVAETVPLTEARVSRQRAVSALTETVSLAEAAARAPGAAVNLLAETLLVTEASAAARDALAPLGETVTVTDALVARRSSRANLVDDALDLLDGGAPGTFAASHPSVLRESYNHIREAQSSRAVMQDELLESDVEVTGELDDALIIRLRFPEVLSWANSLGTQLETARALGETVAFAEAGLGRLRRLPPAFAETVALVEALVTLARYQSAGDDTYLLSESQGLQRRAAPVVGLQTVTLSEAGVARRRVAHQLADSALGLTEAVAARFRTRVDHRESVTVWESLF